MSLAAEKNSLRKIFREKRYNISAKEAAEKSQKINQNFLLNLLPQIYQKNLIKNFEQIFSLYLASSNEVSCDLIAQYFKKNHIKFCYPKIIKPNHRLDFVLYEENQTLVANHFYPKVFEPLAKKQSSEKIIPDFLILPLLAFDQDLSRLGMGGGFFDRTIAYLKSRKSKIITIGLAYDFQRLESTMPIDKNDQKLDFIVTENFIFSAS